MKFLISLLLILSSIFVSAESLSQLIAKFKQAPNSQKYIYMNKIKVILRGMSKKERLITIAKLKHSISAKNSTSSKATSIATTNTVNTKVAKHTTPTVKIKTPNTNSGGNTNGANTNVPVNVPANTPVKPPETIPVKIPTKLPSDQTVKVPTPSDIIKNMPIHPRKFIKGQF